MASPTSRRHFVASVVYRSLYFLLYLVLFGLLVATPGDAINRSLNNGQLYNIWILAATYIVTILVVAFVYVTRLYINKTELDSIPKGWVPVEKGDVRSAVYRMISAGLGRSASIAYEARPRLECTNRSNENIAAATQAKFWERSTDTPAVPVERPPVWGEIEHPGWSSPNAAELPNLQYSTVLSELPNLIEAKALTLAPPDPTSNEDPPLLDPEAVGLLQHNANMSLRDYISHLSGLGVLEMDSTVLKFLTHYEHARFSTRPITNARFKELMHLFAQILRAMEPFDPDLLDEELELDEDTSSPESYIEDPRDDISNVSPSYAPSVSSSRRRQATRQASTTTWNVYQTAPNSMRSGRTGANLSHKPSHNSLASNNNRRYPASQPSSSSLRSKSSSSSGSVIRLATRNDSTDLPYVLSLRDTTASFQG